MTQEEKKTLSNAILGYLPYKLKVRYYDMEDGREEDDYIEGVSFYRTETTFDVDQYSIKAEGLKPYLRPMESMMDEEKLELLEMVVGKDAIKYFQVLPDGSIDNTDTAYQDLNNFTIHWINFNAVNTTFYLDWLNKKKFDYRGLIPMGLALQAPEGMYNNENLI